MIRLERNILDQANTLMRTLEDHVLDSDVDDAEQASAVCRQLEALLALGKTRDSGMSDECAGMLEEIERRSRVMAARLPTA
ncbi:MULTISPECIES: hypothetical protein [Salinicola]|uniref:hypothetical protein n=1 Tax=Salinicola TaxID=404432 RepID=UPI0004E6A748|nr:MULTISPECIES: hypothetical protein [Salinicola]KFF48140.1 hypothetical protein GY26_16340 [Gammaproteobacteria bacterium MFB021]MCE3026770.1 hypothetical protein [Salinicola sp. DM10]WIX31938.1 hypothetical protein QO259_14135 [Salinicola sp. JS01]